jgi:glyoxylate/hydroxypyruvate reductase
MKIYIETAFKKAARAILRSGTDGDELIFRDELPGAEDQLAALQQADVLLGNPKPASLLQRATNLKWIQLASTGFEIYSGITTPAAVTNLKDFYAVPCAETAIAGILALYRGMDQFSVLKQNNQWVGTPVREGLRLLQHNKVIIMGAGAIGKHVAKILTGFDCSISFYARTAAEAKLKTLDQLEAALPGADIVIACLPGTMQTKGLFTRKMIGLLRHDAIFCNIGRGNLLEDEAALVQALMSGAIGGAVLDVTNEEPLPPDHPLWKCPNLILSQHTGGGDINEQERIVSFFLQNLNRFKQGLPLQGIVQLQRGY